MDRKRIKIAIDGPAGAGKSTIAKAVSKVLNIVYLDTGAMYRAVALKAVNQGIDPLDIEKVAQMVRDIEIDIEYHNGLQHTLLNGKDVEGLIRTAEISKGASDVSAVPDVRIKMVELQREIAKKQDVVMDGRDIGTFVLPDANLKIFLTASLEERAKRRFIEGKQKGKHESLEDIKCAIEKRDKNDSTRSFAPLLKADDAIEIDTTNMSIDEVMDVVLKLSKEIRGE